jgi:hypothetical protein
MLADQSPANNTLHWSKGVGNALQLPTSGGFGNFQSTHFRNNALYLAGGLFPGSGAGGSGQPIWMDFVGKGLSCLNPPSRPNGYPSPTSPYWRVSRNAIGASGNVYLDRGNNALYDANANFNTTMAPIRGFMVPGYGC